MSLIAVSFCMCLSLLTTLTIMLYIAHTCKHDKPRTMVYYCQLILGVQQVHKEMLRIKFRRYHELVDFIGGLG